MTSETTHYPVIVAGSGIAGLSSAIYLGREDNNPLVLEGDEPGGQLTLTNDVANYPGFPEGISGTNLTQNMRKQAEKFGAIIEHGIIQTVIKNKDSFYVELTNGTTYTSNAFIAASGASARHLDIPGEEEYMGNGLSTCATCDGAFFRGEDMIVVGGGDSAFEEAVFLTKFADTVYIVHRREEFRAEDYLLEEAQDHIENGNIEIVKNTEVVKILGDGNSVNGAKLVHHPEGHPTDKLDDPETDEYTMNCGAIFYAIGHIPNTEYLEDIDVELNDEGYINTYPDGKTMHTRTNVDGLFAAGDVVDSHYQQAATASGMGVKAALDVDEYLTHN